MQSILTFTVYHFTTHELYVFFSSSSEIFVQMSPAEQKQHVTVTCNTSCPPARFIIYKNRIPENQKIQSVIPETSTDIFSCAVKGLEDLLSAEICEYEPT